MDHYLIVPGLGGSRIYCNCCASKPRKLYPVLGSLSKHFFDKNCKSSIKPLKTVCAISIYKNLALRIGKQQCNYFPYDWRWQTPLAVAKKLYEYLQKNSEVRTFSLIGHSNGGFIIRILLEYLKLPRATVNRVYICGTPFFGSPNPMMYKNEINLYEKLKNQKTIISIKPLLLSRRDIDRIFQHCRNCLVYFIPTYIFRQKTNNELASELGLDEIDITMARAVHLRLANFELDEYVFYFNISRRDMITTSIDEETFNRSFFCIMPTATNLVKKINCPIMKFSTNIRSDSLVIPTAEFPRNSVILYDDYPLSHSLIMNSTFLSNFIMNANDYSYK